MVFRWYLVGIREDLTGVPDYLMAVFEQNRIGSLDLPRESKYVRILMWELGDLSYYLCNVEVELKMARQSHRRIRQAFAVNCEHHRIV